MKKLPKTLKLDCSKWRCGGDDYNENHGLGKGLTQLLNYEGYSCCLGQFAIQSGASKDDIRGIEAPNQLNFPIQGLVKGCNTSRLNNTCIDINDDSSTTIIEKIKLLRKALAKTGRKLIVRNLKKALKRK